jgi:hypothetical protein
MPTDARIIFSQSCFSKHVIFIYRQNIINEEKGEIENGEIAEPNQRIRQRYNIRRAGYFSCCANTWKLCAE